MEQNNETPKNKSNWLRRLYGLDEPENEELEFIYTSYANANDKPSKTANIVFLSITLLFLSAIIWASFAEIDELARGEGRVIPTDRIQKVQSLDGGIITEILIREGQLVKQGDPLMQIDTTRFQATLEESKQEYLSLLAVKQRLEIEAQIDINKALPEISFPQEILDDSSRYDRIETILLKNRFNELKSSVNVLDTQLGQKKQELREIENTIKNLSRSYKLIQEQKKTLEQLVASGARSRFDLLDKEKEFTNIASDLEAALLSVDRSKLAINEAESRISERINTFKSEAARDLQSAISNINKFEARIVGDQDRVARTTLTSPVDGIVQRLYFNTIGGVIQPGLDLIEIVPESDVLVVEAKIDPRDIAFINPSQNAIVKITAYDFSIYGGLDAEIIEISADTIVDETSKDGRSFYRVLVRTNKNYLEKNGNKLPIIPGMVASVDIVTGKKTILDFIMKPILKVKDEALRER